MKSSIIQKIKTKVDAFKEERKPTTKEQQLSFGILKSSEDMLEPPKKERKKREKEIIIKI